MKTKYNLNYATKQEPNCNQGFISQPETGYRRPPVPVYRTG